MVFFIPFRMKSIRKPRNGPVQLRNGFYFEICTKGMKKGVKIRSESKKAMEDAASLYTSYKKVIIPGEYKKGVPAIEIPVS